MKEALTPTIKRHPAILTTRIAKRYDNDGYGQDLLTLLRDADGDLWITAERSQFCTMSFGRHPDIADRMITQEEADEFLAHKFCILTDADGTNQRYANANEFNPAPVAAPSYNIHCAGCRSTTADCYVHDTDEAGKPHPTRWLCDECAATGGSL